MNTQHSCQNTCAVVNKSTVTQTRRTPNSLPILCAQATELAELTSKISQLEDAKKKKDEEAKKWQKRVRINGVGGQHERGK